jgi:hypothetical protein
MAQADHFCCMMIRARALFLGDRACGTPRMKNRLLPATRPVYDPPVLSKPNAADINPADGDRRLRRAIARLPHKLAAPRTTYRLPRHAEEKVGV